MLIPISIIISLPLYFLPGFALLRVLKIRSQLNWWNTIVVSIILSLIIVPYLFVGIANIVPIVPSVWILLLISAGLLILGWLSRRKSWQTEFNVVSELEQGSIPRSETLVTWLFIILFAAFANLPRITMFFQGGRVLELSPFDEPWHLAELVSVARSGIPPMHYLYPDLGLNFYYAAWIYPAIVGNFPYIDVSLNRAMAIHVFIQVFAFLSIIYYIIRSNFRSKWARVVGMLFFTLMGGFDLFAKLPKIDNIEWWHLLSDWMSSKIQISQFITLYAWVPHHLAAGMAFALAIFIWNNIDSKFMLKVLATGILLGFSFIVSPFVFLFFSLAIFIGVLTNIRKLNQDRKKAIFALLVIFGAIFLVGWYPFLIYSSQGGFALRHFRVYALSSLRGGAGITRDIDEVLTLLGFPVVMVWLGLIEMGLSFGLYSVWIFKNFFFSNKPKIHAVTTVMAILPIISFFLVFLITDKDGGDNFAMRGMIPAQIVIVLSAIYFVEYLAQNYTPSRWQKAIFIYLFICILVAQSFSMFAELRSIASRPIKIVLSELLPDNIRIGEDISPDWPVTHDYIHWVNLNTTRDSLIIDDCPPRMEYAGYRLIERLRLIDPRCAPIESVMYQNDFTFVNREEWNDFLQRVSTTKNVLEIYRTSTWSDANIPVYFVDHGKFPVDTNSLGEPVYEDRYVKVYRLK